MYIHTHPANKQKTFGVVFAYVSCCYGDATLRASESTWLVEELESRGWKRHAEKGYCIGCIKKRDGCNDYDSFMCSNKFYGANSSMTAMHKVVERASDIWNQKWPIKSFEHPKHWKWLSVLCRGVRCLFSRRTGTSTLTAAGDVFLVQTHSFVVWERLAHEVTQVSGPSCCMRTGSFCLTLWQCCFYWYLGFLPRRVCFD